MAEVEEKKRIVNELKIEQKKQEYVKQKTKNFLSSRKLRKLFDQSNSDDSQSLIDEMSIQEI